MLNQKLKILKYVSSQEQLSFSKANLSIIYRDCFSVQEANEPEHEFHLKERSGPTSHDGDQLKSLEGQYVWSVH